MIHHESIRQQKHSLFLQELEKLNEQQRVAVEQIDGPVAVKAGPGTGKTQILSRRIANMLYSDLQIFPENILCITYTDAGAIAMRERLVKLIGTEAYKLHISTYHSFCNKVIQENRDYFQNNNLRLASSLDQILSIRETIDTIATNSIIKKFGDSKYNDQRALLSLFDTIQKEGWVYPWVEQKVNDYIENLPHTEGFYYKRNTGQYKKGDLKLKAYEEEILKMKRLTESVKLYDTYRKLLREKNLYTYFDMILWVVEAFNKQESLLLRYQEKFQYILADEFQDTNGIQYRLLQQLCSYYGTQSNVFVVGDDDQSIFSFQGADGDSLTRFTRDFDVLTPIQLKYNYRSSQGILNAASHLIQYNYDTANALEAESLISQHAPDDTIQDAMEIWACDNVYHQQIAVIEKIEELIHTGVSYEEIAIIGSEHKYTEPIANYLLHKKIPVSFSKDESVLKREAAHHLLKILKYLKIEQEKSGQADDVLFEILHLPYFEIPYSDIRRLLRYKEKGNSVWLRSIINNYILLDQEKFSTPQKIYAFGEMIDRWSLSYTNDNPLVLLHLIVKDTRMVMRDASLQSRSQRQRIEDILALLEYVNERTFAKADITIQDIIQEFLYHEEFDIAITPQKTLPVQNSVKMLTAHGSKGLEYDYVFIVNADKAAWEGKRNSAAYSYPATIKETNDKAVLQEKRRLFYVALTRARKKVYICYNEFNEKGKTNDKTQFIEECQGIGEQAKNIRQSYPEEVVVEFQSILQFSGEPQLLLEEERNYIYQRIKKLNMSASRVNEYIRCATSFYFDSIIEVPQAPKLPLHYGSILHKALELSARYLKEKKEIPSLTQVLQYFDEGLLKIKPLFSHSIYEEQRERGHELLPKYYEARIKQWKNNILEIERYRENIYLDNIPINGKIDKVLSEDGILHVIDYKTKKPSSNDSTRGPINGELFTAGDNWRQLVFYKILIDAQREYRYTAFKASLDYIEYKADTPVDDIFTLGISDADVHIVKEEIKEVYQRINAMDFSQGCGKDSCRWCNFTKEHNIKLKFHD